MLVLMFDLQIGQVALTLLCPVLCCWSSSAAGGCRTAMAVLLRVVVPAQPGCQMAAHCKSFITG